MAARTSASTTATLERKRQRQCVVQVDSNHGLKATSDYFYRESVAVRPPTLSVGPFNYTNWQGATTCH